MNLISSLAIACVLFGSLNGSSFASEFKFHSHDPDLPAGNGHPLPDHPEATDSPKLGSASHASVQNQAKSTKDIERALQQTVTWDYIEVPAIEVFESLKDDYGINVYLDQSAKDDSLSEDTLITCRLKNVRMASALRLMFYEVNATYLIQDGILRIISKDVASDPEFFRRGMFDCRELLQRIAVSDKRIGKPVVVRILPVQSKGGGGGGSGGGIFSVLQGLGGGGFGGRQSESIGGLMLRKGQIEQVVGLQEVTQSSASAGDANNTDSEKPIQNVVIQTPTAEGMLLDLIKTLVDPDGWDETNGDGSMMIMSGFLVVAQQEDVLDDIKQLLSELESSMKLPGRLSN